MRSQYRHAELTSVIVVVQRHFLSSWGLTMVFLATRRMTGERGPWGPRWIRETRTISVMRQNYGFICVKLKLGATAGLTASLFYTSRPDFRWACPGGITTGWLPMACHELLLSVGLVPAGVTICSCWRSLRGVLPPGQARRRAEDWKDKKDLRSVLGVACQLALAPGQARRKRRMCRTTRPHGPRSPVHSGHCHGSRGGCSEWHASGASLNGISLNDGITAIH